MGEQPGPRRHRSSARPVGRPVPGCGDAVRSAPDRRPDRFDRRVVTLAPGEARPYVSAEWCDALVVVEDGRVELEDLGGDRRGLARGAVTACGAIARRRGQARPA